MKLIRPLRGIANVKEGEARQDKDILGMSKLLHSIGPRYNSVGIPDIGRATDYAWFLECKNYCH